jgi:hypothetical protein
MADSITPYRTAMNRAWPGWWVNWPLSRHVRVGDVLDTTGGTIRTAGDLAGRGITATAAPVASPADFLYDSEGAAHDSEGAAQVDFKLSGAAAQGFSALTQADAGALVTFGRTSAVLAIFTGLTQAGLSDTRSVAQDLVRRYWSDNWADELVVVNDVITANAGTLLAAAGTDASAELASAELRATVGLGSGVLTLADLAGGVAIARATRVGMQWVGADVTPFYQVFRLKRTWLAEIKVKYGPRQPVKGAAPEPVPPLLVEEAGDDPGRVLEPVPDGAGESAL